MDFDAIENLSEDEIKSLYEEEITDNEQISVSCPATLTGHTYTSRLYYGGYRWSIMNADVRNIICNINCGDFFRHNGRTIQAYCDNPSYGGFSIVKTTNVYCTNR